MTKLELALKEYTRRAQFHDADRLDTVIRAAREEERTKHSELIAASQRMICGLVRCAELKEHEGGGDLWDDESRMALKEARARGWGKGHKGSL